EILEKLGRGGMGVVYKARQTSLKRLVALKMVRTAHRATPDELSRLKAEAEAVARLQHPNIVHIYEVGEHDGRPFFSMEYVEGGTLHASLRKQLPHPEEAAKQIETLAQAMHVAHGRDVIHRDLKPSNVLLGVDGSLKITDFGVAMRLEEGAGQTPPGAIVGTA